MRCERFLKWVNSLPMRALDALRLLSSLPAHGKAPFQCLLLVQPQCRNTLSGEALEQLRQRILASYHLGPLSPPETRDYVRHRLITAGWNADPAFDEDAFAAIHQYSSGIPRKINTLCSRVLLAGFLEDRHRITQSIVVSVANEL